VDRREIDRVIGALESGKAPEDLPRPAEMAESDYQLLLGEAALRRNDLATAGSRLHDALAMAPDDPRVHRALGDYFGRRRDWDEARHHWERATSLDPAVPRPWLELGRIHYQDQEWPEARAALGEWLKRAPEDAAERPGVRAMLEQMDRDGR